MQHIHERAFALQSRFVANEVFTIPGYHNAVRTLNTISGKKSASLRVALKWQFAGLISSNAAAVAALYWNQTFAKFIAEEFPQAISLVSLIPFATLAGYATGVGVIAFAPSMTRTIPIKMHLVILAGALLACSLASNIPLLTLSSTVVGIGAAVAQRLLATAAQNAGPDRAGSVIGTMIAVALVAVLGVRLAGDGLAELAGWRAVFVLGAVCVIIPTLLGRTTRLINEPPATPLTHIVRRSPLLWSAALQQAASFAAYNAAWMTLMIELPGQERVPVVILGSGAGLLAAMLSGRLVDRFVQADVAKIGTAAIMGAAGILLPIAYAIPHNTTRALLLPAGMMMLDAGLQSALVANQARTQALQPAARGRLAALLTVCGALGGALGAGIAYLLCHRSGSGSAIFFAAVAGTFGFAFSYAPALLANRRLHQSVEVTGFHGPSPRMPTPVPTGMACPEPSSEQLYFHGV